jgi:TPP-dependent trihydroxycyclohexane-1,2-dione (THcHDO) dehydratase
VASHFGGKYVNSSSDREYKAAYSLTQYTFTNTTTQTQDSSSQKQRHHRNIDNKMKFCCDFAQLSYEAHFAVSTDNMTGQSVFVCACVAIPTELAKTWRRCDISVGCFRSLW